MGEVAKDDDDEEEEEEEGLTGGGLDLVVSFEYRSDKAGEEDVHRRRGDPGGEDKSDKESGEDLELCRGDMRSHSSPDDPDTGSGEDCMSLL